MKKGTKTGGSRIPDPLGTMRKGEISIMIATVPKRRASTVPKRRASGVDLYQK